MRNRGLRAGVLAAALLAGCASPAPRPAGVAACGPEPDEVLACVRAREDALGSLRARFTATTRRGGEEHASTGVLLVAKPQRFRLRLMLPLGLTIFDYVREGDRSWVSLPLQGDAAPPQDGGAPAFADIDLAEAFLRGPFAFPGTCAATRAGGPPPSWVAVACRADGGALLRTLRLDPATATILDETSWNDGRRRLELRYDDYRPTGGTLLPWHIRLAYPERDVTLDIEIQRYEVNPALAADLFEPPPAR